MSPKNRIEVAHWNPRVSPVCGRYSAQAKETRLRSLLPRCKEHVTCAMSLCDCPQSHRIIEGRHRGATTFDLNEDDLQGVAAPHASRRLAMIFAYCHQIDYADRLTTRLTVESDELPTCP